MNFKFWKEKEDTSPAHSRLDSFLKTVHEHSLLKKVDAIVRISGCSHYFGYLGHAQAEDAPTPEECLTCKHMLECRKRV